MLLLPDILDIIGALFGVLFLITSLRGSRSLIGSFFKNYYWFMVIGAISFIFGFLIRPVGSLFAMNPDVIILLHGGAMILEGALFVYAGYVLPNDVRKYLRWNEKHGK